MESKIEANLLAQIVIKGNLNINSILYKQHNFILNKVPGVAFCRKCVNRANNIHLLRKFSLEVFHYHACWVVDAYSITFSNSTATL